MRRRYCILYALVLLGCVSCAGSVPGRGQDALFRGGDSQETLDPELRKSARTRTLSLAALTQRERQALAHVGMIRFSNDAEARALVLRQFVFLNRDIRLKVASWLTRSEKYLAYTRKVFQQKGLPEDLVYLAMIESGYNPEAVSSSGAAGIWQFMPATGRRFNLRCDWWIDERRDPYQSAQAAASYLATLHQQFKDWSLAIAAYNAGEGKISRAIAITRSRDFFDLAKKNYTLDEKTRLRDETLDYVPRFIAMVCIASNLSLLGYQPLNAWPAPELHALQVPGGTNLHALAQAAGMTPDSFAAHNLAFRRDSTPPGAPSTVYVPALSSASVRRFLATPQAARLAASTQSRRSASGQQYTVRPGDTAYSIARRFNVCVNGLCLANNLASRPITPGQVLRIPSGTQQATTTSPPPTASRQAVVATNKRVTRYRVRSGDTVWSIARKFNVDPASIVAQNKLKNNTIRAGEQITITLE